VSGDRGSTTPDTVPSWAAQQLTRFLTTEPSSSVSLDGWRHVDTATGPRDVATVVGLGLVQFDARTHEVDEIIFSKRLDINTGRLDDPQIAQATAAAYAARHYRGFSELAALPAQTIDHGSFTEYRFQWQQRLAEAWTPNGVTVGINARTGAVAYYYADRIQVRVATTPRISSDQARENASAVDARLLIGQPELRVELIGGTQAICWVVPLQQPPMAAPHVPQDKIVFIDALTGQVRRVATAS
jgi:hypothetical protein